MRFLLMIFALTLSLPLEAAPTAKKATRARPAAERTISGRTIANKMPSRVLTFACRDAEGEPENVIGLTHMSIDLRDTSTGAFSTSIYLKTERSYQAKTINGTYTSVPGGYILRARWQSSLGEFLLIHVHPAEKTAFPGIANKQLCELSAQLESP